MIDFEFESALQALGGIAEALDAAGVDSFVPSHEEYTRWSDADSCEVDGAP